MENNEEKNIQRVDNKPASIYSIFVFALVFLLGYIFYPQISMIIPFLGQNVTIETNYSALSQQDIANAQYVVIAVAGKDSALITDYNGSDIDVYSIIEMECVEVISGSAKVGDKLEVAQLGGSTLIKNPKTNIKTKYNVKYEDCAKLESGKTYLLFIDGGSNVVQGAYGCFEQTANGSFSNNKGHVYTKEAIIDMVSEATQ